MIRRQPTRRRGTTAEVDHEHLADLILRRCEDCSPDYHIAVARRFLEAEGFSAADVARVLVLVQNRLPRRETQTCVAVQFNGSVLCDRCHKRLADHPTDPDNPQLVITCNGRRVKLCL